MFKRLRLAIISTLLVSASSATVIVWLQKNQTLQTETPVTNENWLEELNQRMPASAESDAEDMDIGEDPNLAMPSDRRQTEADVCYNCASGYSPEISEKNHQGFKDISLDIESANFQEALPADPSDPILKQFPEVIEASENSASIHAIETAQSLTEQTAQLRQIKAQDFIVTGKNPEKQVQQKVKEVSRSLRRAAETVLGSEKPPEQSVFNSLVQAAAYTFEAAPSLARNEHFSNLNKKYPAQMRRALDSLTPKQRATFEDLRAQESK